MDLSFRQQLTTGGETTIDHFNFEKAGLSVDTPFVVASLHVNVKADSTTTTNDDDATKREGIGRKTW